MAFCKNCGTLMENDVCPNCGTTNVPVDSTPASEAQPVYAAPQQPVTPPQPVYTPSQPVYPAPQPPYGGYQPPYYQPPQAPKAEESISALGWIWRFLIPCIPVVGWIINLIMLFIWMGDDTKEESFRNWAKAQLIMMAIALGLVFLVFIFVFVLGVMTIPVIGSAVY